MTEKNMFKCNRILLTSLILALFTFILCRLYTTFSLIEIILWFTYIICFFVLIGIYNIKFYKYIRINQMKQVLIIFQLIILTIITIFMFGFILEPY